MILTNLVKSIQISKQFIHSTLSINKINLYKNLRQSSSSIERKKNVPQNLDTNEKNTYTITVDFVAFVSNASLRSHSFQVSTMNYLKHLDCLFFDIIDFLNVFCLFVSLKCLNNSLL